MEISYLLLIMLTFLVGIIIGRASKNARSDPFETPIIEPYRKDPPAVKPREKTPRRGEILSPVPKLPALAGRLGTNFLWKVWGKKTDPLAVEMTNEDRALIISLLRSGQLNSANLVYKQVTNLKEPQGSRDVLQLGLSARPYI